MALSFVDQNKNIPYDDKMSVLNSSFKGYETVAQDYDAGRPDYPLEAINLLVKALDLKQSDIVLDVGAGTGKLTKALVSTGVTLQAVEPVAAMRSVFRTNLPTVPMLVGCAEKIPLSSSSLDAIVVGTAFHWFDGKNSLHEFARVLRPKGRLGLIWNIFDEEVSWVKEIRRLLCQFSSHTRHDHLVWKQAFVDTTLFSPLQHRTIRYSFPGTQEDIKKRLLSANVVGRLSKRERKNLFNKVIEPLKGHQVIKGSPQFDIPYRVEIYWCRKLF